MYPSALVPPEHTGSNPGAATVVHPGTLRRPCADSPSLHDAAAHHSAHDAASRDAAAHPDSGRVHLLGPLHPARGALQHPGGRAGRGRAAGHQHERWRKPDGTVVVRDGNRVGFGGDRWPGETVQVALQVDAPATPGTYTLAFDNYHEGKGYFSELGGVPTSNHTIAVEP